MWEQRGNRGKEEPVDRSSLLKFWSRMERVHNSFYTCDHSPARPFAIWRLLSSALPQANLRPLPHLHGTDSTKLCHPL